jgi:hypothetical protein
MWGAAYSASARLSRCIDAPQWERLASGPRWGPERLMFLGDDYEARRSALWFDPTGRARGRGPARCNCCGMIGPAGAVGFNGEGRTGGVKRPLFPHEGLGGNHADENFSGYDAIGVQNW